MNNTAPFEAKWVAETLEIEGEHSSQTDVTFTFVTSDSRKVQPGCLFVALQGENHDGHRFIPDAIKRGATGILCHEGTAKAAGDSALFFPVADTLAAYRKLAHTWMRRFPIPVVMVAGSVGKTTTKELLASILEGHYTKVLKTEGSQNGFIGIPMTLLELRDFHEAAVVEVGIDEPGAMAQHIDLVRPEYSVLTAIGPEHLERLKDIETIAKEESLAITEVIKLGGKAAVNLDDPWIRPLMDQIPESKAVSFSLLKENEGERTLNGELSPDAREVTLNGLGFKDIRIRLPLPGEHNARNLLCALSISREMDVAPAEALAGLNRFKGAVGRSEIRALSDGTEVICDYYNANPTSVEAALKVLHQISEERKTWLCLADMLELGPGEEGMHRALAESISRLGIGHVLLFGPRMKHLADELSKKGFGGDVRHFESKQDLATALIEKRKPGEPILIKGSRSMRMEEVFEALK